MSDSDKDPLSSLLSSFALGPSWAKATGGQSSTTQEPKTRSDAGSGDRPPRRDDRRMDDHKGGPRDRGRDDARGGGQRDGRGRDGERKPFRSRDGQSGDRRTGPPRMEEIGPAEGVRVILVPDAQAVHLIGKEVHQVARVYPLYDVAKILLAERSRCRALFETQEPAITLFSGKLDPCLFLTREEALRHLWNSDLRNQFIEEETIDVDPPTGNFQVVARCGLSGDWLGPPNFHAYQVNIRRVHRERYPNMPFAAYTSKIRTERGEEAVNAWLETMKRKTRWRIKGDGDDAWIDNRPDAERALASRCFDQAFESVRRVEVNAAIDPKNLSPSLFASLKMAGNHARNHPAVLIPAVCKAVESEHLPVFKRQGKLFTGPARPQPLPLGATLAERPGIMVEWIRANKPAKLEGLWQAVLPEGGTAPPAEFAADLFWLLHQGHILLFTDDTLVVQEIREQAPHDPESKPAKRKKKKKPGLKPEQGPNSEAPSTPDEIASAPTEIDTGAPTADAGAAATPEAQIEPSSEESAEPPGNAPVEPTAEVDEVPVDSQVEAPGETAFDSPAEPQPELAPDSTADEDFTKNASPGVDGPSGL